MSQQKALQPVVSIGTSYQVTMPEPSQGSSKALQPHVSKDEEQSVTPEIAI